MTPEQYALALLSFVLLWGCIAVVVDWEGP